MLHYNVIDGIFPESLKASNITLDIIKIGFTTMSSNQFHFFYFFLDSLYLFYHFTGVVNLMLLNKRENKTPWLALYDYQESEYHKICNMKRYFSSIIHNLNDD